MKSSRANSTSFRLHHIGKTTSTRKSSQTFYNPDESFKLAALNSVTRGIKHADLSFMTGTNLQKLRVEPLELNEGHYTSAHDNLTEVRTRYDQMKKQRLLLQKKIQSMKEEIGKFAIFKNEYESKIKEAKNRVVQLRTLLEEKKGLVEDTLVQKKVMHNMESRHKADKVVYDQRKFNLEKQLEYRGKQLSIFKREGIDHLQGEDRTSKIYEKMTQELERERLQREEHIKNLQIMIEEKMQLQNANMEREADLVEIAERAIQDKDQNEKQWRKIFLTHIFVNKMLRNKIEKEMEKFRTVQFAFKEIKTATGVADAKALVTKYLNKEAVYGELLSKIADNEKTIQQLKNKTDQLVQEMKQLQIEKQVLQSIKIKSQDLHDNIKDLEEIENKAIRAENYSNKMTQWVRRQLKKILPEQKNQEEQPVTALFIKLLNTLSSQMETATEPEELIKYNKGDFGQKETDKNVRVIPKKSRKNSMGEEIYDVDEEQAPANAHVEQLQHVNYQHQVVVRENEKFMRQLKKRKQEERKVLVEKKEVKKETKIPQPKKEQD